MPDNHIPIVATVGMQVRVECDPDKWDDSTDPWDAAFHGRVGTVEQLSTDGQKAWVRVPEIAAWSRGRWFSFQELRPAFVCSESRQALEVACELNRVASWAAKRERERIKEAVRALRDVLENGEFTFHSKVESALLDVEGEIDTRAQKP